MRGRGSSSRGSSVSRCRARKPGLHAVDQGGREALEKLRRRVALFFHTYLRGGDGRCAIGTLEWIDGWTLERKLDSAMGPACD
jgi:hypothetical protein